MADYDAVRRLAEEQGFRLLKHPSGRKVGAWKVKDRDGDVLCWPTTPDDVEDFLRSGEAKRLAEQRQASRQKAKREAR